MGNRRNQGRNTSQTQIECYNGGNTLKDLLMSPKDKASITKQSNILHWFYCSRTECDDEYIGVSARTFEERYCEGTIYVVCI